MHGWKDWKIQNVQYFLKLLNKVACFVIFHTSQQRENIWLIAWCVCVHMYMYNNFTTAMLITDDRQQRAGDQCHHSAIHPGLQPAPSVLHQNQANVLGLTQNANTKLHQHVSQPKAC